MVDSKIFKKTIGDKISQDYKLEFLGTNFDNVVNLLSESKANKIYNWIERVIVSEIQPIVPGERKKKYKKWQLQNILLFRYPLKIGNVEYRIIFVKVKNSVYIEFHFSDHKYYDKIGKKFYIKKKNY